MRAVRVEKSRTNDEGIWIEIFPVYSRDWRPGFVNHNLVCAVSSKRACSERFFGVLEKIQLRSYRWPESDCGGDDEISIVDAVWGKCRKGQGELLAPLQRNFQRRSRCHAMLSKRRTTKGSDTAI